MKIKKKKVLCIFSNLLGNKILSRQYQKVLDEINDIQPTYFFLNTRDYEEFSAPFLARLSCTLEIVCVARKKFKSEFRYEDFDLIIINGFELVLAFSYFAKKTPVIMIQDTTPKLAQRLIRQESANFLKHFRSFILGSLTSFWCRKIFSTIKHFLPISQWCADSLICDYKIASDNVTVVYPPFDMDQWQCCDYERDGRISLIFVANNFELKGGPFLLEIFKKYFSETCTLRVVSNDSTLSQSDMPENTTLLAGIQYDEVSQIFSQSDIFVFPTWRDQFGLVIGEAMAAGLPVVTRNVGGIPNLVKDGHNGFLMPYDSTEEEWAEKIQYLIDHPEERKRMGNNSRKMAEEMFDMNKFSEKIRKIVECVIEEENV